MHFDQERKSDSNTDIEALIDVINVLLPDRRRSVARRLRLNPTVRCELDFEKLKAATSALSSPLSDKEVDSTVALSLLDEIDRLGSEDVVIYDLNALVIEHVERRWSGFAPQLTELALDQYKGYRILQYFPRLTVDGHFVAQLAEVIRNKSLYRPWLGQLISELHTLDLDASRILISAVKERNNEELSIVTFNAIARKLGWTPWVSLFAILQVRPDYAEPTAVFGASGVPQTESRELIAARDEMERAIEPLAKIREVAAMLLDLTVAGASWHGTGILARPAETRAAYVEILKARIGDDEQLRRSVIEALLWLPIDRATDLAQFAAVAIAEMDDRDFLIELEQVGVGVVRYGARAVRAAKFNDPLATGELPTPRGLVQNIAANENMTATSDAAARTWLGDRDIERLIERTIVRVETKVAVEYDNHGDEGEDRLLSSLFTELALRFSDLDAALDAMARAASAPYRAKVSMRYRNVDRHEEGKEGIKGAEKFSADLCLIVDPKLDGISLGRRVTLVQAKRLHRHKGANKQGVWGSSFRLDPKQPLDLQKQTHSSVYFFLAPPLNMRGVPVIPTQLVEDLSNHEGSGRTIRKEVVGIASRSLSDWLTYDALALRVGDPHPPLVEKAGGVPGGLSRALLMLPTVEIEIGRIPCDKLDR